MKIRKFISQSIMWIVLIAALFVFSIPFLFMITNTFEEFSYVLPSPPKLFPDKINFAAYKHILQLPAFFTAVKNSFFNTAVTTVLTILVSTLSAYGFAKIDFPGREKFSKSICFH